MNCRLVLTCLTSKYHKDKSTAQKVAGLAFEAISRYNMFSRYNRNLTKLQQGNALKERENWNCSAWMSCSNQGLWGPKNVQNAKVLKVVQVPKSDLSIFSLLWLCRKYKSTYYYYRTLSFHSMRKHRRSTYNRQSKDMVTRAGSDEVQWINFKIINCMWIALTQYLVIE